MHEWEGKIAMMKNLISKAMQGQRDHVEKLVSTVQNQVAGSNKSIGKLRGQMNDM